MAAIPPEGGYKVLNGVIEKWVPIYGVIEGDDFASIVSRAGRSYTPPQTGWKVERRELPKDSHGRSVCNCKSGRFQQIHGWWVHTNGCNRPLYWDAADRRELTEDDLERIRTVQSSPSDEYFNGMYPTLGGRNARDPKSWITGGRAEWKRRTKGMILWGSAKTDKSGGTGNTLPALEKVRAENEAKRQEKLREGVERYVKKQLPRTGGEL